MVFKKNTSNVSTLYVALLLHYIYALQADNRTVLHIERRYSDNMVLSQWKCFVKSTKGTDCWGEAKGP